MSETNGLIGYVIRNKRYNRFHTGYFSSVAPKVYINAADAKGARTKMLKYNRFKPDDLEIWQIDALNPSVKINPNPIRKRYA
jgi:hypothetical protein